MTTLINIFLVMKIIGMAIPLLALVGVGIFLAIEHWRGK